MVYKIRRRTNKREELSAGEKKGPQTKRREKQSWGKGEKVMEEVKKRCEKPIDIKTLDLVSFKCG